MVRTMRAEKGRRAIRRDRGAALVEAALITPVIMAMILMVVEVGMLLFSDLTVTNAAGDGARVAIVARNAEDADAQILARIKRSTTGLARAQIERIVIYQASSLESAPPAACTTGAAVSSPVNHCSVYTPADLDKTYQFLTCGWCPEERNETDLIGVWIRMNYRSVTGLLNTMSLTEQKILPIEYDT
jgi:Flp pilus assembly protein TadG